MSSHLFALKEAEIGRDLESLLEHWRKDGISYRKISSMLSEAGTPVKRATVDMWCKRLGIDPDL